eukprot:scaffold14863_cov48-Phaeocystis_antarctica.AAC.4
MLWASGVKSRTLYPVKPCRDSTHSQRDLKEKQGREKDYVCIMKARGRGGGREPPGTHSVCRYRAKGRPSEAQPRAAPGPAGGHVSPSPGLRSRSLPSAASHRLVINE